MRMLENLLLAIGLTALGATTGGIGLTFLALVTIFRDRPGEQPSMNWGAYYGALFTLLCGGLLGAVLGFSLALGWINHRDERPWKLTVWLGIAVGLTMGLTLKLTGLLESIQPLQMLINFWPTALLTIISLGTAGGLLGSLIPRKIQHRRR